MKKSIFALFVTMALVGSTQSLVAQATATQNVTLAVNSVYKIAVSGNPGAMTITTGTAGTDALTTVTENSTSYSITQNVGDAVKITAHIDATLSSGFTLKLNLASQKGTSAGDVNISQATSGSAVNLVTGIAKGADADQVISYKFSADASAGTLAPTARVITLTLTN